MLRIISRYELKKLLSRLICLITWHSFGNKATFSSSFLKTPIVKPEAVLGKLRKGCKLVYANDTKLCENVVKLAENCNVLIHDATVESKLESKANEPGHSSARQAADIAKRAVAKLLFMVHFSPRYKEVAILEKEAQKIFKNSICAHDFMVWNVKAS